MLSTIERLFVRTERPLYTPSGHAARRRYRARRRAIRRARAARAHARAAAPDQPHDRRERLSRVGVARVAEGYVGRGTFVCAAPEPEGTPFAWRGKIAAAALRSSDSTLRDLVRHSSDSRLLSLAAGEPAIDKFPNEAFQEAVSHVLRTDPASAWRHGPTEGQPALREAIAERYNVPRDSVLILSGAQQGLDLLARCLVDPGDAVIIDRPGTSGAIQSFRAAGAKLIGWDVSRADSDELEDLLVRYRPKLIYTNPTFQNPTGVTLPIRTRRELLSLAQRYRVPIVEDATYQDLYFHEPPPPSLRELDDHNLVIYLNSFSKVMAPGLRLGWIAAAASIVDQIAIIKQRLDPHTPNLVQFAIARLMRDGAFEAHLRTIRAEHAKRCTQMVATIQRHIPLGYLRFGRPAGGLYLWCRLAPASAPPRCISERWPPAWRLSRDRPFMRIPRATRSCGFASRACFPGAGREYPKLAGCLADEHRLLASA